MSLIITVRTAEGIVMASDSRMSFNRTDNNNGVQTVLFGIHYTDTSYKTFLCDGRIGISTCGLANINRTPIANLIQNYINNIYIRGDSVESTAKKLLNYITRLQGSSANNETIIFHVAGYQKENNVDAIHTYRVDTAANHIELDQSFGARWDGEIETLTRLIKNGYIVSQENVRSFSDPRLANHLVIPANSMRHPEMKFIWDLMTLQDGIDFAKFAIRTTADTMRFQAVPKTVGGPIDILVIRPDGAQWIKRKELHA